MSFKSFLPPPRQVQARLSRKLKTKKAPVSKSKDDSSPRIPPYGQRQSWLPRSLADFGDGGAYPEIHVAQYPLDMGKRGKSSNAMALSLDKDGKVKYDAVVTKGRKNVFSKAQDLVPIGETENVDFTRPDEEEERETVQETKRALDKLLSGNKRGSVPETQDQDARTKGQFVRYTPATRHGAGTTRVIKMVEVHQDPLEPSKFMHKRVPGGPPSPPVPVMHSPTRKVTKADQAAWNIPPAISNWKNPKGFTIPLEQRLAADGRGLQDNTINDRFAHFAEALYLAEQNAREEVARRSEIRVEALAAEREAKERGLQELAKQTRQAKESIVKEFMQNDNNNDNGQSERDRMREQRRRELEREARMAAAGIKGARAKDRDVSERIALGEKVPMSKEAMFDQRLFQRANQSAATRTTGDDSYNIYEKPLFNHGSAAELFKAPSADDGGQYGTQEDLAKLTDTSRFEKDDKGKKKKRHRSEPVQFEKAGQQQQEQQSEEKPAEDDDLLAGLDDFLASAKKKSKAQ